VPSLEASPSHVLKPGWLAYAVLLTLAVIAGETLNIWRGGPPDWLTYANWVLSLALLVALWAYSLQRPVGARAHWRAVFWIVLFANIVMLVPVLIDGGLIAIVTGVLSVLVVPAYVAAWRYAYRSAEVWDSDGERG
jgi:hypothetical protein